MALSFSRLAWADYAGAGSGGLGVSEASVDALVFDVRRIVEAEEGSGWLLDETAHRQIHPTVMASVCRAVPAVRARALALLERDAAALGDPRTLFVEQGRELTSEVAQALSLQRGVDALAQAILGAARECPFWLPVDPEFRGVQSTRDRLLINFDTGGTAQLRRTEGRWTLGAGGFGRLLAGYSFTRLSLLAGLEFGGGAMLEPKAAPTQFAINYLSALPVIARLHSRAWNVDLEAAPVALFQAGNTSLSYGARGGVTVGISALRLRGVLPWVGLGVAAEYHFGNAARPEALYLRGGLRVGGVWDP